MGAGAGGGRRLPSRCIPQQCHLRLLSLPAVLLNEGQLHLQRLEAALVGGLLLQSITELRPMAPTTPRAGLSG